MDEARLDELVEEAAQRLRGLSSVQDIASGRCLSLNRARKLALNPDLATADGHLADCARCRSLVDTFARVMPHLSYWSLVAHFLGISSPEQAEVTRYHLLEGGCRLCQMRMDSLAGTPFQWLRLPPQSFSPSPDAASAEERSEVLASSTDGRMETEMVFEDEQITLEIRTRDAALNHQLVAYTLRARDGRSLSGFDVIRADVQGWFSVTVALDAQHLRGRIGSAYNEALVVSPVSVQSLDAEELELLRASASADTANEAAWRGWLAWLTPAAAGYPADLRQLLAELTERFSR